MSEEKKHSHNKKSNNFGLAISMGAGVGLIFGMALFDNLGLGLVIGAGFGIVFSSING